MHFVHQFQCFEVFLKCVMFFFFQKTVFSQKFSEPLSVSIDPICFSINRNCFKIFKEASVCFDQSKLIFDQSKIVNQVFKKKSEFDLFKLTFQKVFQTFLSPRIVRLCFWCVYQLSSSVSSFFERSS